MGKIKISPNGVGAQALNVVVWVSAALLSALTLVSSAVIASGFGDLIPNEWNVIFLIPKEPSAEVSDTEQVWTTDTQIEIFKAEYTDGGGNVTVKSDNGEAVFAPGAQTEYSFKLKNNGNVAVDYSASLAFALKANGVDMADEDMPLLVKVFSAEKDDYIVGSADTWIPVTELGVYEDGGTLGINSYNEYTLSIKWEFEEGKDERDTRLGNLSAGESVEFSVDIDTYAEQSDDPHAVGGATLEDGEVTQVGGDFNVLPMATLLTFTACSGAAMSIGILAKANAAAAPIIVPPTSPVGGAGGVGGAGAGTGAGGAGAGGSGGIPPAAGGKKKDKPEAPSGQEKPKKKRVRKKRVIKQNPGRWQNHKKNSKRKRSRRK